MNKNKLIGIGLLLTPIIVVFGTAIWLDGWKAVVGVLIGMGVVGLIALCAQYGFHFLEKDD